MRISELIRRLEEIKELAGDAQVEALDRETGWHWVEGAHHHVFQDSTPTHVATIEIMRRRRPTT